MLGKYETLRIERDINQVEHKYTVNTQWINSKAHSRYVMMKELKPTQGDKEETAKKVLQRFNQ